MDRSSEEVFLYLKTLDLFNRNMTQTALALEIEIVYSQQIRILGMSHCYLVDKHGQFILFCACIRRLDFYIQAFKRFGKTGYIEMNTCDGVYCHQIFKLFNIAVTVDSLEISDMKLDLSDETLLGISINIHFIDILDKLKALMLGNRAEVFALSSKDIAVSFTYLGVDLADISLEHIIRAVVFILVDFFKKDNKLCSGHTVDILGKL